VIYGGRGRVRVARRVPLSTRRITINYRPRRAEGDEEMEKILILTILAVILFVACEGPAGPPGPAGENGAWQIIETITLTADTNIVTFDGISDDWEMLEIRAWGNLVDLIPDTVHEGNGFLRMRFNSDSSDNYSHGDFSNLGSWCIGYSQMDIPIYLDYNENAFVSFRSQIYNFIDTAPNNVVNPGYEGFYTSPDSSSVSRIDIYKNIEDRYSIAAGSEFILLGLVID